MENENIKQGKILDALGRTAKYNVYQVTAATEELTDKQLVGVANSYQEACKVIQNFLAVNRAYQDPYWRYIMNPKATFIDYGSWTKWIAIVPPVSEEELKGDKE